MAELVGIPIAKTTEPEKKSVLDKVKETVVGKKDKKETVTPAKTTTADAKTTEKNTKTNKTEPTAPKK